MALSLMPSTDPTIIAANLNLAPNAQRDYNASGLNTAFTGSIAAGSTTLTLNAPWDGAIGQGVFVQHAGSPCANSVPASVSVSVTGTPGTASRTYAAIALDDAGAYTGSTAYVTVTNAPDTLDTSNYVVVTVTLASGETNTPVALYGGVTGKPLQYLTPLQENWYGYQWEDNGLPYDPVPSYLPTTLPASGGLSAGQSGWFASTVTAITDSTITLADAAITGVSEDFVAHDDTDALNALMQGVPQGGIVYIPPGTYNLHADVKITTDHVTVQGQRYVSILSPLPGTEVNALNVYEATGIVVDSLYVAGNNRNMMPVATTRYQVDGGFVAFGATDLTIQHCDVNQTMLGGIQLHASTGVRLLDCHATQCWDNGIFGRPGNDQVDVIGCSASGGKFSGIAFIRCTNVNVSGSRGFNNGPHYRSGEGAGLDFEGCQYSSFVGCEAFGNGVIGINLRYTGEGGSTIQNCTDIVVANNIVRNNAPNTAPNGQFMGTDGILAEQSDRIVIANNYVADASTGISVGQTAAVTITDNQVTNNQGDGVEFYSNAVSGIAKISGNQIWNNTGDGINLIQAFNHIQVSDNKIFSNGLGGSAEGVNVGSGNGHQIIGNTIYDNTDNGVLVNGGVSDTLIKGNVFGNTANGTQGRALYEVSSATNTALVDNVIAGQKGVPYAIQGTGSYATHNIGAPPMGWIGTAPTLPSGTGSSNAVTNTQPMTVRVYLTGQSGTHVVDPNGVDVALPHDPSEVTLDPNAKIYFAATVPTSWQWYRA